PSTEISPERCASLRATSFVIQSSSLVYASDHFGFTELPSQREIPHREFFASPSNRGVTVARVVVAVALWLCRFALVGDGLHRCLDRLFVAQVLAPDRFQVLVQLVDQRLSGGNVELYDVGIGHVLQVFHERS